MNLLIGSTWAISERGAPGMLDTGVTWQVSTKTIVGRDNEKHSDGNDVWAIQEAVIRVVFHSDSDPVELTALFDKMERFHKWMVVCFNFEKNAIYIKQLDDGSDVLISHELDRTPLKILFEVFCHSGFISVVLALDHEGFTNDVVSVIIPSNNVYFVEDETINEEITYWLSRN